MSAESNAAPDRRRFLKTCGAAAGLLLPACATIRSATGGDRLRLGIIGVGNRGAANMGAVKGERIVALCDVDSRFLDGAAKQFPDARTFRDFNQLLLLDELDAVVISTPDHSHFPAAKAALERGLDVYCEKPLTHTVRQARTLARLARQRGAITQMGIQIHAQPNYRRVVELVRSGAIGTVREVHVFCSKNWSGGTRPKGEPPVPEYLDWDLWLAGATPRPYHPAYHPAGWRGYWDFGGGTLGDMACHYMDLAHWALELGPPASVDSKGPVSDPYATPGWMIVDYEYPAIDIDPAVRLTWYDGGARPALLDPLGLKEWKNGVLFVGDQGHLVSDYTRHVLGPEERFKGFEGPKPFLPEVKDHHQEWLDACRSRRRSSCDFSYAGPLTEAVLLGNVSYRTGRRLELDPTGLSVPGDPQATALL